MTDKNELDVSIEEVTHAVAEITKMDSVIAELTAKYEKVIFDVDTPDGMKAAKAARKEIRDPRYLIENMRKEGKAPILELGRNLDGRANGMKERLLNLETPIDETIKEEETRVERERQAKIEAELARVEAIQERISAIRSMPVNIGVHATPDFTAEKIEELNAIEVDDSFEEFAKEAADAKAVANAALRSLHSDAIDRKLEQERIAAERKELEELRAAEEKRQSEEKARREAEEEKARKAREAAEKKEREALEAQRKKQAEEQAKIDSENDRIAKERAELEAARKVEADRKAAEEKAEADRKAAAIEAAKRAEFPGVAALVEVIAEHFNVDESVAMSWLAQARKAA